MTSPAWPAPHRPEPVDAVVQVPGSKSVTNRALVLAAQAAGRSRLRAPLRSRDTELMAAGLRALGVAVRNDGADWAVDGAAPGRPVEAAIEVGNAGTVLRFLPPLAALAAGRVGFDGDPAARRRPVRPLLEALRSLGIAVDDAARGHLPFTVQGSGAVAGGAVQLDASGSSQLVSALLLVAPSYADGLTVRHVGRPVPSRPHLDMTVAMLRDRGVRVDVGADEWTVHPGPVAAVDEPVEPDLSSAAPFLAAAVVTGGRVSVPDWPAASTQPGARLPELLTAFGARAEIAGGTLTVQGPDRPRGCELDLREVGELTPVLAAVAALATSRSRFTGIPHLRGHETDRLAALATELGRLGGDVRELPDGLEIRPRPLHAGAFRTYDDHRLAMAAAVVGLAVPGVAVENVATTAKTLPGFVERWTGMLAGDAR